MLHKISDAVPRPDFSVDIEWDGSVRATVDLSAFVANGEVTEPLRDTQYFRNTMTVESDGLWIGWPCGVDIDADALWYLAHQRDLARDYGDDTGAA